MQADRYTRFLTTRIPRFKGAMRVANFVASPVKIDHGVTVEARVLGFNMILEPHDFVDRRLFFAPQLYDWWEVSQVRHIVREGDNAIDIGAHIGFYSLLLSRLAGKNARILAVEPTPRTYERLRGNLAANSASNVTAINCGVGDATKKMRIWLRSADNSGGNSFVLSEPDSDEGPEIDIVPLLDILREQRIPKIRFAKFDVEGMEHEILSKFFADAPLALWPEYLLVEDHDNGAGKLATLLGCVGYRRQGGNSLNRLYWLG